MVDERFQQFTAEISFLFPLLKNIGLEFNPGKIITIGSIIRPDKTTA
jgi:hypothetical protein